MAITSVLGLSPPFGDFAINYRRKAGNPDHNNFASVENKATGPIRRLDARLLSPSSARQEIAALRSHVLIPDFIDGVLPDGVHTCTLDEAVERFGRFQRSDQRLKLTEALRRYIKEVRDLGVAAAVIIDGSYVTIKAQPNDIDIILVLRKSVVRKQELMPAEYNVESKRTARRQYGFDVLAAMPDTPRFAGYLEWLLQVRPNDPDMRTSRKTKGVLRIDL